MRSLPTPPRRCDARALWLILSTGAALLVGIVIALALGGVAGVVAGAAALLLLGAAGWRRLALAERTYDQWIRISEVAMRVIRGGAAAVAYFIVAAVRLAGSRVPWNPPYPAGSAWQVRQPHTAGRFTSISSLPGVRQEKGGLSSFLAWGRASKNPWVWALAPALLLLRLIEPGSRTALRRGIYPLY